MYTIKDLYEKLEKYNVINPILTYKGEYIFQDYRLIVYKDKTDNLFLNSIVDNQGNRYARFRDKYFFKPFTKELLDNIPNSYLFPLLCNMDREDGKGRYLTYAYEAAVHNFVVGIGVDIEKELSETTEEKKDEESIDKKEINSLRDVHSVFDEIAYNRKLYKEKRDLLLRYKRDRRNFEEVEKVAYLFAKVLNYDVKTESDIPRELAKEIMFKVSDERLDKVIKLFTDVMFNLKYLAEYIEKGPVELPIDEFKACFEPDKFYLLYMKTIIENQEGPLEEDGKCGLSFVEVAQYLHFIDTLGLKEYNPCIKFYDIKKEKIVDYYLKDLRREYEELRSKCLATRVVDYISDEQIQKMGLSYDQEAYLTLLETIGSEDDTNTIVTNWDVLPAGTKEVMDVRPGPYRNRNNGTVTKEERVNNETITFRKFIFNSTKPYKKIVGKNKFSGYQGYIYKNGLVAFEIFNDTYGRNVQNGATYIMNIRNFVELCKLTKQEIIEHIKYTGNQDVKRLYHTCKWADNLKAYLNSVEETKETSIEVHARVLQMQKKPYESNY